MLYYRVKPQFDGHKMWREHDGKITCDGEYLAGELFTVRELSFHRLSVYHFEHMFERVNISKKKVYWAFGKRYPMAEVYNETDFRWRENYEDED